MKGGGKGMCFVVLTYKEELYDGLLQEQVLCRVFNKMAAIYMYLELSAYNYVSSYTQRQ